MQIIIFKLKEKYYALQTDEVEEITKKIQPTSVPNAPAWVKGLINLRGYVVTLLDLALLLEIEESLCYNNIIIYNYKDEKIGLLVEDIIGVKNIEANMIRRVKKELDKGILGIVQTKDYIINLIDINMLLD
ncbi:MAG: chemotaxis protein CheW [Tissierellia bacterium]|jgi:purine-binding chemotaxis protein CheW|nr:chemotaxis protein CheW [Tissierellia bacterium]